MVDGQHTVLAASAFAGSSHAFDKSIFSYSGRLIDERKNQRPPTVQPLASGIHCVRGGNAPYVS